MSNAPELMGPGFFVFFTDIVKGGPSDGDGSELDYQQMYEENLIAVICAIVQVINEQT